MAAIKDVVKKYQGLLKAKKLLKVLGNKDPLDKEGVGTLYFCTKLCEDSNLILEFLKEEGLCGGYMQLRSKDVSDDVGWKCWNCIKEVRFLKRKKCNKERTISFGSWFSLIRLILEEIMLITYEIVVGT